MIKEMYTVFDNKSKAYLEPFLTHNKETAMRIVINCLRDPNHSFAKNPEDYQLFFLGKYDDRTAQIDVFEPDHIVSLHTINIGENNEVDATA